MDSDLEEGEIKDDTEALTNAGRDKCSQKPYIASSTSGTQKHLRITPTSRNRFRRNQGQECFSTAKTNNRGKYASNLSRQLSSRKPPRNTSVPDKNLRPQVEKGGKRRSVETVENSHSRSLNSRLIVRVNNDKRSTNRNGEKENESSKGRKETETIIPVNTSVNSNSGANVFYRSVTPLDELSKGVRRKEDGRRISLGSRIEDISDISDQSDDDDNRSIILLDLPSKISPELITIDSSDGETGIDEDVEELQLRKNALQDLMTRLNKEVKNTSETELNDVITCDEDEEPYSPFDDDGVVKSLENNATFTSSFSEVISPTSLSQAVECVPFVHQTLSENDTNMLNGVLIENISQYNVEGENVTPGSFLGTYVPTSTFLGGGQFYSGHVFNPPLGAGDVDMRLHNFSGNSVIAHSTALPFLPVIAPNPFQATQSLSVGSSDTNQFMVTGSADNFSVPPVNTCNSTGQEISEQFALSSSFSFVTSNLLDISGNSIISNRGNTFLSSDLMQWPSQSTGTNLTGNNVQSDLPPLPPPLPKVTLPPPLPPLPPPDTTTEALSHNASLSLEIQNLCCVLPDPLNILQDISSTQSKENEHVHNTFDKSHGSKENTYQHLATPITDEKLSGNNKSSSNAKSLTKNGVKKSNHKSVPSEIKSSSNNERLSSKTHISSQTHRSSSKRRISSDHSDKSASSRCTRRSSYKSKTFGSSYSNIQRRKRQHSSPSPSRRRKADLSSDRSTSRKRSSPESCSNSKNNANTEKGKQYSAHSRPAIIPKANKDIESLSSVPKPDLLKSPESEMLRLPNTDKPVQLGTESAIGSNYGNKSVTSDTSTDALDIGLDDEEILRAQLLLDIARKKTIGLPPVSLPSSSSISVTNVNSALPCLKVGTVNPDCSQITSAITQPNVSSVSAHKSGNLASVLKSVSNPRSKNRQIVRVVNTLENSTPSFNLRLQKTINNNNAHSKANLHSIQRTVINTNLLKKNVHQQSVDPVMRHFKITVPNKVVPLIISLSRDESSSEDEAKEQPKSGAFESPIRKNVSPKSTVHDKKDRKILPKNFEASLDNLLKASRQQTGKILNSSKPNSSPVALKHLPPSKQAEYIRLKRQIQEHERKINKKLERHKQTLEKSKMLPVVSPKIPSTPLLKTGATSALLKFKSSKQLPVDDTNTQLSDLQTNESQKLENACVTSSPSTAINSDDGIVNHDVSCEQSEEEIRDSAKLVECQLNVNDTNSVSNIFDLNCASDDLINNMIVEDTMSSDADQHCKSEAQQFHVDVVKEREELYLREKLLKAALLKKMEASNDRLNLRKIESDIISSRRCINREITSLLSEMVHMSDLKVVLKTRQDKVSLLREQLYSAEAKLSATANKLQVHEIKRKNLTTRVFAMRKECVSIIKQCKQQGSKIEGQKYKIPAKEALEMKTKLAEVRNQNLVFQRENLKQKMSPEKTSTHLPLNHLLSKTYRRSFHPSATLAAANRVKKSFHGGLRGKRHSITSHCGTANGIPKPKFKLPCNPQQIKWNARRIAPGRQLKHKGSQNNAWLTKHDDSEDDWDDQSVFLLPKILFKDLMMEAEPPPKKPYVQKPVIPFRVYESPLDSIREQNQFSDSSPCVMKNVDPFVTLCYFELRGMCSSTKCPFQHLYRPTPKVANAK